MTDKLTVPPNVLDMRCKCAACENRTQATYRMSGLCVNCGWKGTAIFRCGDSASMPGTCPTCQNDRVYYLPTEGNMPMNHKPNRPVPCYSMNDKDERYLVGFTYSGLFFGPLQVGMDRLFNLYELDWETCFNDRSQDAARTHAELTQACNDAHNKCHDAEKANEKLRGVIQRQAEELQRYRTQKLRENSGREDVGDLQEVKIEGLSRELPNGRSVFAGWYRDDAGSNSLMFRFMARDHQTTLRLSLESAQAVVLLLRDLGALTEMGVTHHELVTDRLVPLDGPHRWQWKAKVVNEDIDQLRESLAAFNKEHNVNGEQEEG